MEIILFVENNLWLIFLACYVYQFVYTIYMIFYKMKKKEDTREAGRLHKFGFIIAARNEEKVIGHLIESLNAQNYPKELIKIYVAADNCDDKTAEIAREKGATVYERSDKSRRGKGYALNFLFEKILEEDDSDAYIIFDADNLASPDFLHEINKSYCDGFRVVLGYRNSKNYASNWVSAGYSLWFLRDSEYLNHPRMLLKTSCLVAGTGFLVCRSILEENGGWHYFSLTEDVEFNADMIIRGEKFGYCSKAVFFDEQPVDFDQSWRQRVRWARGFYQVVWRYGSKLVKGAVVKRNFACFDMLMSIFPALLATLIYCIVIVARMVYNFIDEPSLAAFIYGGSRVLAFIAFGYVLLLMIGIVPLITEWKNIEASKGNKIFHAFTFPFFMMTFIPIAGAALFKKVEWEPVKHTINRKIEDLKKH